jgi:TRAP-type transport system periplasmic protein
MGAGRRTFLASALASLAAPAFVHLARADAPHVTLKLHHAQSSVSCVHTHFLAPWARTIEAQSDGRIRIDIFPSMELGGRPAELFDQARDRLADIVWAMPSQTPGRFPCIELFELPFVPSRRALVSSKAVEDFSVEFLQDEFREVHPICFSCADRGILHANRPIVTRAQLNGLRLDVRTRFAGQAVELLGGRAVPMPSAQLPFAVARRVVDGCIVPWDMVPALKLDEMLNAHTDFADYSLSTTTYVLAMNKTSYQTLPAGLKKIIDDNSGQTAAGLAGVMWDLKATAVADAVGQRGDVIVTLEPRAVAHWRAATGPVIEVWRKQMKARKIDGERLLARAHTLLEKYAGLPEPQPPAPPKPIQQPVEAKANPPEKVAATGPAPPSPAAHLAPPPQATIPMPHSSQPAAAPVHWWQFWRSTPATASAAPVPSPAPRVHWWEFWKSAPAVTPATASASPLAPPAPTPPLAPPPAAAIAKPLPVTPPPAPPKTLNIPL